ncbi:MAG: sugar ABC transporter permease YjfF, partial [Clostridiales bacterium]|nr:sugar ABC transporter permease YjfF [Clostridiales bacterium]
MKKPENAVKDRRQINGNTLLLLITIALFIVMYAVGCVIYAGKGFTHLQNFLNILITNAGLLCVACGMTCVMLTGGIDISV